MPGHNDPLRTAISVGVYAVLCYAAQIVFYLVLGLAGMLAGVTLTVLFSAIFANWLVLRIYQTRSLPALGLWWNRASAENLAYGMLGGMGAACLVLAPPLMAGAAHLASASARRFSGTPLFVILRRAAGAVGEELLFPVYGSPIVVAACGPSATM